MVGNLIILMRGAFKSHRKGESNVGSQVEIGWASVAQFMNLCQRVMW